VQKLAISILGKGFHCFLEHFDESFIMLTPFSENNAPSCRNFMSLRAYFQISVECKPYSLLFNKLHFETKTVTRL
jgi:hypothetical protein